MARCFNESETIFRLPRFNWTLYFSQFPKEDYLRVLQKALHRSLTGIGVIITRCNIVRSDFRYSLFARVYHYYYLLLLVIIIVVLLLLLYKHSQSDVLYVARRFVIIIDAALNILIFTQVSNTYLLVISS